jgi:hypothetical protein
MLPVYSGPRPTIDPRLAALLIPHTTDELAALEASLKRDGLLAPLVVWSGPELVLLDGHARLMLCEKRNISLSYIHLPLTNFQAAKAWVIRNQLGRRSLVQSQRATLGKLLAQTQDPASPNAAEVDADSIHKIRFVERHAPDLLPRLRSGDITLSLAYSRAGSAAKGARR